MPPKVIKVADKDLIVTDSTDPILIIELFRDCSIVTSKYQTKLTEVFFLKICSEILNYDY